MATLIKKSTKRHKSSQKWYECCLNPSAMQNNSGGHGVQGCDAHCNVYRAFNFSRQAFVSRSSTASYKEPFLPLASILTCGSTDHSSIVFSGMPAATIALQKLSWLQRLLSQFMRSDIASNGDAEACIPLSPTFGSDLRPRLLQFRRISPRNDSLG